MFPFYHPTSIALIDDDQRFLASFQDMLEARGFIVRQYHQPQAGVDYIVESDTARRSQTETFLSMAGLRQLSGAQSVQEFVASHVGQLRGNPKRFDFVSVAVIDDAMPNINGMAVCKALKGRPVRKILLTGDNSEALAVRAFNEGLIDRYVCQHDADLVAQIEGHIRDLQTAYFRRITTTLKDGLCAGNLSFMRDFGFSSFFDRLCVRENISEYYVRPHPPGIELFRENGSGEFLAVTSEQGWHQSMQVAEERGADPLMLSLMKSREMAFCFPSEGGHYEPRFAENWRQYGAPAHSVAGRSIWLTARFNLSDVRPMPLRNFISLKGYLENKNARDYV